LSDRRKDREKFGAVPRARVELYLGPVSLFSMI